MTGYRHVVISAQGASFLEKGQMWMYANNLVTMEEGIENGDAVEVRGEDGTYYGTGLVSLHSHILVRILSRKKDVRLDEAFFEKNSKGIEVIAPQKRILLVISIPSYFAT